jgi:hypothetical protein
MTNDERRRQELREELQRLKETDVAETAAGWGNERTRKRIRELDAHLREDEIERKKHGW